MGLKFKKNHRKDIIWWIDDPETIGEWRFSFDKEHIFNMFRDYPWELTEEQKEIFDRENPYWAEFFKHRTTAGDLTKKMYFFSKLFSVRR